MTSLGIDPGTGEGAAVCRMGSRTGWCVWTSVKAGYRVTAGFDTASIGDLLEPTPFMFEVGRAVGRLVTSFAGSPIPLLVVEGLFVVGNKQGGFPLIESVGELRAGLREGGLRWRAELRPVAVSRKKSAPPGWRLAVLGLPNSMGDDDAEDHAVEKALEAQVLPRGLTRKEQGAWAESWAMSQYRWPKE